MRRAAGLAVVLLLALDAIPAQPARADGDPASDALVTGDVYFPNAPAMSAGVARQLGRAVAETRRNGRLVRVAIIGTRVDLGAVPALFGRPRAYARFLRAELRSSYRGGLLVVMPAGFGVAGPPAGHAGALAGLRAGSSPDDLGRAAARALQRLARAGEADPHRRPRGAQGPRGRRPDRRRAARRRPVLRNGSPPYENLSTVPASCGASSISPC